MYKKALAGEIKDFTGVQDPYEPPLSPELTVKTNDEPLDQSVEHVLNFLRSRNVISNGVGAKCC
jgi:adenylylsulfate kinase